MFSRRVAVGLLSLAVISSCVDSAREETTENAEQSLLSDGGADGTTNDATSPQGLLAPLITTTELPAIADTYLKEGSPNENQGTLPTLRLQASGKNRALVRFDSAAIAAAGVGTSATLKVVIADNAENWGLLGRPIALYRVTREWSELGATWNCAIDGNTANGSADCTGATQWEMGQPLALNHPWVAVPSAIAVITNGQAGTVTFDVTADVALFKTGLAPNYGWMIRKVDEGAAGRIEFASRETATPPILSITCLGPLCGDTGHDAATDAPADVAGDVDAGPDAADASDGSDAAADASDADASDAASCVPALCDDQNPCTTDACGATSCTHDPVAAGTACSDGNACNGVETCNSTGGCAAGPPPAVDDGNACTSDSCNPANGVVHAPLAAGTSCSDGDVCNGAESCNASGICTAGAPPTVDDGNACTTDACDSTAGVTHSPVAAGTSCSDANACNGAESCNGAGACSPGSAPVLDDGNPCTADNCSPATGVVHTPVATGTSCGDTDACNGSESCDSSGICSPGTPPTVDDGNACTTDACNPTTGVSHNPTAAGTSCSDANACNGAETCNGAGTCSPGASPGLDDGNPCTADSCNPTTGVIHTPVATGT
ncbi:MAG: hypothetical protein JWM74_166, partial [Myxococcaceae bacterium]|nr:hypothetical protein [Myxococcaceae bacterium]